MIFTALTEDYTVLRMGSVLDRFSAPISLLRISVIVIAEICSYALRHNARHKELAMYQEQVQMITRLNDKFCRVAVDIALG